MKKKLLIVKKFGGSSLSTVEKIRKAAQIIKKEISKGNQLIVIVSALGKTTDKLQSIINKISPNGDLKEIDTISKRALRAKGFSWGISEEIGKCIRLLELFSLPGFKNISKYFKIF